MRIRMYTQKEDTWQSTSTPAASQLKSRPFAPQEQSEQSSSEQQEIPDLQAQLKRSERFGYNFANIAVYPSSTPRTEPPNSLQFLPPQQEGESRQRSKSPTDIFSQIVQRQNQEAVLNPPKLLHPSLEKFFRPENIEPKMTLGVQPGKATPLSVETTPAIAVSEKTNGQIQRFGRGKASGPLTNAQVQEAKAWYADNKKQYTSKIIEQIQKKVETEPDGAIGEFTIQAVAEWQEDNPPLTIDGKAGSRTLPAMFPSGLAEISAIEDFVGKAKQVEADWEKLETPEKRAKALMESVNQKLVGVGVPACNKSPLENIGSTTGVFDAETWTIILDNKSISKDVLTQEEAAEIAQTVYHEARHAEQSYKMAQRLAGIGKSAKEIATEMNIPSNIASKAFSNPIEAGSMDALIAAGWYESQYGAKAADRQLIMIEVYSTEAACKTTETTYRKARAEHVVFKNDATQKRMEDAYKKMEDALEQYEAAYEKYKNLPEEADAWRVEGKVNNAYLKK